MRKRKQTIYMPEIQADEKQRADKIQSAKDQAEIQAEKELALKEFELKAQQSCQVPEATSLCR